MLFLFVAGEAVEPYVPLACATPPSDNEVTCRVPAKFKLSLELPLLLITSGPLPSEVAVLQVSVPPLMVVVPL